MVPKRNRRRRGNERPREGIQLRTPVPLAATERAGTVGTGTVRWRVRVGDRAHSAPYVTDGTVYVTGRGVWAVDAAEGSVRWTNADAGGMGSPTVAGDTV